MAAAGELSRELDGVLKAWRRRTGKGGDGARTYSLYLMLQPYPDVRPAVEGSESTEGTDEEH